MRWRGSGATAAPRRRGHLIYGGYFRSQFSSLKPWVGGVVGWGRWRQRSLVNIDIQAVGRRRDQFGLEAINGFQYNTTKLITIASKSGLFFIHPVKKCMDVTTKARTSSRISSKRQLKFINL